MGQQHGSMPYLANSSKLTVEALDLLHLARHHHHLERYGSMLLWKTFKAHLKSAMSFITMINLYLSSFRLSSVGWLAIKGFKAPGSKGTPPFLALSCGQEEAFTI